MNKEVLTLCCWFAALLSVVDAQENSANVKRAKESIMADALRHWSRHLMMCLNQIMKQCGATDIGITYPPINNGRRPDALSFARRKEKHNHIYKVKLFGD